MLILSVLAVGCATKPPAQTEDTQVTVEAAPPEPVTETANAQAAFDPGSISQAKYESTKNDIQNYIEELNTIIKNKNYNAWTANLSDEYFNEISDPEFLKGISEWPILKSRKIVLKTAKDYFDQVVVPSRTNIKVDDIEFTSQDRVKVFTINSRNERLRMYDLEQTGNTWKIIN